MSHASEYTAALPEVPAAIRDLYVPHRASVIEENLRAFETEHPGVFDAMAHTIDMLRSQPGIAKITVDYDEEDVLYPVTIWARTTFPLEERLARKAILEDRSDDILKRYPDLVLVAIL